MHNTAGLIRSEGTFVRDGQTSELFLTEHAEYAEIVKITNDAKCAFATVYDFAAVAVDAGPHSSLWQIGAGLANTVTYVPKKYVEELQLEEKDGFVLWATPPFSQRMLPPEAFEDGFHESEKHVMTGEEFMKMYEQAKKDMSKPPAERQVYMERRLESIIIESLNLQNDELGMHLFKEYAEPYGKRLDEMGFSKIPVWTRPFVEKPYSVNLWFGNRQEHRKKFVLDASTDGVYIGARARGVRRWKAPENPDGAHGNVHATGVRRQKTLEGF